MKKRICYLLAACMMFGLTAGGTVFAEGTTGAAQESQEETAGAAEETEASPMMEESVASPMMEETAMDENTVEEFPEVVYEVRSGR